MAQGCEPLEIEGIITPEVAFNRFWGNRINSERNVKQCFFHVNFQREALFRRLAKGFFLVY